MTTDELSKYIIYCKNCGLTFPITKIKAKQIRPYTTTYVCPDCDSVDWANFKNPSLLDIIKLFYLRLIFILKSLNIKINIDTNKKTYRTDLSLYEEKITVFRFFKYYKYSIFTKGKLQTETTFNIKSKNTKKYLDTIIPLPSITVGRKEFKENYKSNKWLIPINKELDLTLP